ncbi:response regulator transcription factor [Saccharibacillus deserti]|uniref:response regulator transcription factor n=1 Tax=Saccharibacillus deserti TaxID=1634444 RepID=UPI001556928B|nr:response regulator [Saccharibacillus deserti]
MLNVLVVDDDKLVRQGLISTMPWAEFGLRVVGEARNGEKALEFLETHEVDLLLTDLAMPVMSGLELMRSVRKRYPRIFIVVLTLHQDFSYVQEALRLGAIDYIAKVQLEEERFEEVLGRIRSRIDSEHSKDTPAFENQLPADTGYALIGANTAELQHAVRFVSEEFRPPHFKTVPHLAAWLAANSTEDEQLAGLLNKALNPESDCRILRLSGLRGLGISEISAGLSAYLDEEWFYARRPDKRAYVLNLAETQTEPDTQCPTLAETHMRNLQEIRLRGSRLDWVYDAGSFEALLADLAALRLPSPRLHGELLSWGYAWNAVYEAVSGSRLEPPERLDSWFETEKFMRQAREQLGTALGSRLYSIEVRASVTRAAALVHARLSEPLQAGQLAREVNMSRSYFSQCFRDIFGITFNEYVRQQRIDRACTLLAETRKTVQWVAERTGYTDEKYFSRIFREQTGLLPSEFRQRHLPEGTNVR